jgi:hypothetical protein
MALFDPGGEVAPLFGRLLHDELKGRGGGLFGASPGSQGVELNDSDRCSESDLSQMRFGQAMRSASGAIPSCALPPMRSAECRHNGDRPRFHASVSSRLSCVKKGLHALLWLQGHGAPALSGTGRPSGAGFTVGMARTSL